MQTNEVVMRFVLFFAAAVIGIYTFSRMQKRRVRQDSKNDAFTLDKSTLGGGNKLG